MNSTAWQKYEPTHPLVTVPDLYEWVDGFVEAFAVASSEVADDLSSSAKPASGASSSAPDTRNRFMGDAPQRQRVVRVTGTR